MLDLAIVLAFVVYAVTVGFRARRTASTGLDQYFLAGRTLRGWQAGTSMAATQFAADTPLLVTGLIATGGVFLVWRLTIYGIAFLVMAFVFARMWRRAGVLTDAELTELRYSGRGVLTLRVVKAVYYGTVINCVVLAMVLVATVRIAEVFLPWHEWLPPAVVSALVDGVRTLGLTLSSGITGSDPAVATADNLLSIAVILAFTSLYSMTGGLRSVVATDMVQFALAMLGTLAYAVIVVREVGGLEALPQRLIALYGESRAATVLSFSPRFEDAMLPFVVIVALQWLFQMNSDGTGYLAQRCMACASERDATSAGVTFTWLQIVARTLLWLVIGVGLLVIFPFAPESAGTEGFTAGRELTFVTGIDTLLPPGIRGVMLTGLLAALASTIDTHLNWGASYWSNDVYRRLVCDTWLKREPGRKELLLVARLSNVLIVALALAVMTNLGSIQSAWFVSLLFGAGIGAVLVLRWLWERINLWAEVVAMLVSLVAAPLLLVLVEEEWVRLGVVALVSTTATLAAAVLTRPTHPETLARFYRTVRPAGWWRTAAVRAGETPGESRSRLRRGLLAALVTAVSVYGVLFGLGRILIRAPGANPVVTAAALALGLGMVPLWWRRVRRELR